MKTEFIVKEVKNAFLGIEEIFYLTDNKVFSINDISVKDTFNNISVIEILTNYNRIDGERVLRVIDSYIFKLLSITKGKPYLFLCEQDKSTKSKLRSHKGLFYEDRNKILKDEILQNEIEFEDDQTLIGAVLKITNENHLKYFRFNNNSFILQTENDSIFSKLLIEDVIRNSVLYYNDISYFNFPNICNLLLNGNSNNLIYRFVDDGNSEMGIQIFSHKNILPDDNAS